MTPEDWGQLRELFHTALELPPESRVAWLEQATGGDAARVAHILELLRASDSLDGFLDRPAAIAPEDVAEGPGAPALTLSPGAHVGTYEVIREIGRGGMGVVYQARDLRLGRDVALKALPLEVSADPAHRERLRREARAVATIAHPSVATVYALEEVDGCLFIVSEFVDGRSLREALAPSPFSPEHAVAVAIEVAGALGAAHAAGVVHRDLKPENVLVTANGTVKVVDFGIAHVDGLGGTRLTQHGALLGTPAYMAPEQLAGAAVDARADVYAMGLLVGEMVAGRHPLADGGPPALPLALAGIVTRCLQPEPGARFASAEALGEALRSVRDGTGKALPAARWWWTFHQAAASTAYALLLVPAWLARRLIDAPLGTLL
ncbi:MAG TPA: serine/threonine-protein kinase, partial [Vicinamibacterales bacterium]